jgi:hypothetical protein
MAVKNDEYKVVYFPVPKAACTSIRLAIGGIENMHKINNCNPEKLRHYTWFTFVRHPLARLISLYHDILEQDRIDYLREIRFKKQISLIQFLSSIASYKGPFKNVHFKPMHVLLDASKMNFIGRVENIGEDWDKLNLPKLTHKNRTEHDAWYTYYYESDTGNLLNITRQIEEQYKEDFETFDYNPLPKHISRIEEWLPYG